MNNLEAERKRIGQELHQAETAIGAGRRAVYDLVRCEPVDETAVLAQRAEITEARLERNMLRRDLEDVKLRTGALNIYARIGWAVGCADA